MASIKDVAKYAGVGVGTVSRALNGSGYVAPETRKKIDEAVERLGYMPNELARQLFRNRTGIIGVIVPDLEHPFFAGLTRNIEMNLYRRGYKAMICNTVGISNREKEYLDMLGRNMVDGLITAAHALHDEEYLNQTKPIVSLDREFANQIPMIGSDHAAGGRLAAELLIRSGCRKVLWISNESPHIAADARYTSFSGVMQERGVQVENLVLDWNIFDWTTHYQAISEYLHRNPDIDGAFGNDMDAIACRNVMQQMGKRVPEEFCAVGFDGMDVTRMVYPPLTAVCQDVPQLAARCVDTLLDLVEGKTVERRQILEVGLQRGGTVRETAFLE